MATKNTSSSGGIADLLRKAGQKAKSESAQEEILVADPSARPAGRKIFSVLDYIEQPWGLEMRLFPAQRFIVKLFYGLELDSTVKDERDYIRVTDMFNTKLLHKFTEKEYLEFLYNEGRCNIKDQSTPKRRLTLALGRRAGKTTLSGIFASYEVYRILNLYDPQHYYGLPSGNRIQLLSVATDKDQASLLFSEVTSHLAKCDYFKPYLANNTQTYVRFRTPEEIDRYGAISTHQNGKFASFNGKASLRVTFKAATPKGLRGAGNIVVILDEMAHFATTGATSANDIYDAVTPSTAAFSPKDPYGMPRGDVESRIICISSPLNREGKFFELFHQAMQNLPGSQDMVAIQSPTWEVNPTVPSDYYRQKYHEDPAVFMTEFGAQFSDRVRGWVEREIDLTECIDPNHRPLVMGRPREPHQLGIDVGLRGDGTAIAITKPEGDRIVHAYHEVWYAGQSWKESNPHLVSPVTEYAKNLGNIEQIDFDEIAKWIIALTKKFYITDGVFDRWNGIPLEQSLFKAGLSQFRSEHFTAATTSRMYQNFKMLMFDKRLKFYDYPITSSKEKHSPHIAELLGLQAQQISKNIISVEAPKLAGAHDDVSDALIRAVWLTSERLSNIKVVSGGSRPESPPTGPGLTLHGYQNARARLHGYLGDRPSSRMQKLFRRR